MPAISRLRFAAIFAALAAALMAAAPARASTFSLPNDHLYGSVFASRQSALDKAFNYTWDSFSYSQDGGFVENFPSTNNSYPHTNTSVLLKDLLRNSYIGKGSYNNATMVAVVVCGGDYPAWTQLMVSHPAFLFNGYYTANGSVPPPVSPVYYEVLLFGDDGFHAPVEGSEGRLIATKSFRYVYLLSKVTFDTNGYMLISRPNVSIYVEDGKDNAATSQDIDSLGDRNEQAFENLGDKLTDTSGSDSIASGAVDGATSALAPSMNLMAQVSSIVGKFTSISADEDSTIDFPGIQFGEFVLPPQKVDIWQHFRPLQTPCKVVCTGVLIFLWLRGVQALIGRIFFNETDVIVDEE